MPKEVYIVMRVCGFNKSPKAVAVVETKVEFERHIKGKMPWQKHWLKKVRFYPANVTHETEGESHGKVH